MEDTKDNFSSKNTMIQVLTDTLSNCKFESAADIELKTAIEKWLKISDPDYMDMNMIVNRYKSYILKTDVYVRVISTGACYLSYIEFSKKYVPEISKYYLQDDNLRNGKELLLIKVATHFSRPNEKVCICQDTTTCQVYLIEARGVVFVNGKNVIVPRDDYKEYSKPRIKSN